MTINFFEDILNQRPIKVTPPCPPPPPPPVKWGNFDRTWSNFNRTWGNFDWPIKVTPSVNKVNIIIVNKNKPSFLWCLFWVGKHVGECVNKKTKYFYVYIFNISNFDRNFWVTLIAAPGPIRYHSVCKHCFKKRSIFLRNAEFVTSF